MHLLSLKRDIYASQKIVIERFPNNVIRIETDKKYYSLHLDKNNNYKLNIYNIITDEEYNDILECLFESVTGSKSKIKKLSNDFDNFYRLERKKDNSFICYPFTKFINGYYVHELQIEPFEINKIKHLTQKILFES